MKIIINNNTTDSIDETLLQKIADEADKHFTLNNKEVGVVFVDNKTIKAYNKQYRNKDYPTDVLTFPDGTDDYLGDILISLEMCKKQAVEYEHSFARELGFLFVHGLLHTLGYDHHTKKEEQEMFGMQDTILNAINVRRNKVKE